MEWPSLCNLEARSGGTADLELTEPLLELILEGILFK